MDIFFLQLTGFTHISQSVSTLFANSESYMHDAFLSFLPPVSAVEVIELVRCVYVCVVGWVCETYVVHHLVSTGLHDLRL